MENGLKTNLKISLFGYVCAPSPNFPNSDDFIQHVTERFKLCCLYGELPPPEIFSDKNESIPLYEREGFLQLLEKAKNTSGGKVLLIEGFSGFPRQISIVNSLRSEYGINTIQIEPKLIPGNTALGKLIMKQYAKECNGESPAINPYHSTERNPQAEKSGMQNVNPKSFISQ